MYFVYIMASKRNGTLYIGVTNDLVRRGWEHKQGTGSDFTKKYDVNRLVYLEEYADVRLAIQRERTMKDWKRQWKVELIQKANPDWDDLYNKVVAGGLYGPRDQVPG